MIENYENLQKDPYAGRGPLFLLILLEAITYIHLKPVITCIQHLLLYCKKTKR